jgi:hypothetical protein
MNPLAQFRAGDWLTLLGGLLLVAWLYASTWHSDSPQRVIVRAQGQIVAEAGINENRRISAQGPLGTSLIEIADRRVRVAADPSPRQYCVKQGWLSRAGDAALCLPNQVSVELLGASRRFDSLSY